ncbi:PilZ domain-containing protein, partial [bacterium]
MDYNHPARKFPRVPAKNTILVKKLGDHEIEGFSKTGSLGLGGCMFLSDESFGVGAFFEILISVKKHVVKASGRVVYELPDESGALR